MQGEAEPQFMPNKKSRRIFLSIFVFSLFGTFLIRTFCPNSLRSNDRCTIRTSFIRTTGHSGHRKPKSLPIFIEKERSWWMSWRRGRRIGQDKLDRSTCKSWDEKNNRKGSWLSGQRTCRILWRSEFKSCQIFLILFISKNESVRRKNKDNGWFFGAGIVEGHKERERERETDRQILQE